MRLYSFKHLFAGGGGSSRWLPSPSVSSSPSSASSSSMGVVAVVLRGRNVVLAAGTSQPFERFTCIAAATTGIDCHTTAEVPLPHHRCSSPFASICCCPPPPPAPAAAAAGAVSTLPVVCVSWCEPWCARGDAAQCAASSSDCRSSRGDGPFPASSSPLLSPPLSGGRGAT